METPLIAGLDVGTTNIKAVIFTGEGRIAAEASVPTPTYYPRPTWANHKPEEMWQAVASALRQATSQLADSSRIASIAVASMGEAGVPLDSGGTPTTDIIAWYDQRTQPQVDWLAQIIGKDHLFSISGLSLQPIFGLCKLLWLRENEPQAFTRTVRWLNLADYIAYRLSGEQATDYSLASRTLVLNLEQLTWDKALLSELQLSPALFAPLSPSGAAIGTVTPEAAGVTGLPASARVAAGGHDHVCGALASGVIEPGDMLDSMGSAEAVFLPLAEPVLDLRIGRQGYTQGAHVMPGSYYILGGLYTSGTSIEWWRELFDQKLDYATLVNEAGQVAPGSLGVSFLPYLRLANPPYDDPKGRGAFIGLTTDVKRGTLFRAILEGLAYESRITLEGLLAFDQVMPPRNIYATGGNTRNRLLMQIKASVLNRPITVLEVTEATSLGAAILGGLGAGVYPDVSSALAQLRYAQKTVDPLPDLVSLYDSYFHQVYRNLYLTLKSLHHKIHDLQAH